MRSGSLRSRQPTNAQNVKVSAFNSFITHDSHSKGGEVESAGKYLGRLLRRRYHLFHLLKNLTEMAAFSAVVR